MTNGNQRRQPRKKEDDPEPTQDDLSAALEQLDRAAARVRQLVYRIRPMLRVDEDDEQKGEPVEERKPVRGQFRRRNG